MRTQILSLIILVLLCASCISPGLTTTPATTPETIVPLDGKISLAFEETNGIIKLKLQTIRLYGVYNNDISANLEMQGRSSIEISIGGIIECNICQEAMGPARKEFEVGPLEGKYKLTFEYSGDKQSYTLSISAAQLLLTTKDPAVFLEPKYLEWQRLPSDSIWLVTHNGGIYDKKRNVQLLDKPVYDQLSAAFYRELEQMEATRFFPAEGHYTNYLFIPPWENWQTSIQDRTRIPSESDHFYEYLWPDIRYYHFSGNWTDVAYLVETYKNLGLSIYGIKWDGQKIYAVKIEN